MMSLPFLLQLLAILETIQPVPSANDQAEFSLAGFSNTAVYSDNSAIDINLVGEGFHPSNITAGGALECHTNDTTCCRDIDNPNGRGRGEWYQPDGTVIPPHNESTYLYLTRGHMVIRLNKKKFETVGVYQCVIPGTGGGNIARRIILVKTKVRCNDLPEHNNTIIYTPPCNVSVGLAMEKRYIGTIATYSCSQGYYLVGESLVRVCGPNGTWNGTEPSCVPVKCGALTNPENGQVDTASGTIFGSVAIFDCNPGYILSHQQMVMCNVSGMWSPVSPTCVAVDCGPLTDPDNGQVVISSGTTFGSTAIYTCDTGYTLSGTKTRTCGANGQWNTVSPICEVVLVQLRFGKLNCVDFSSTESIQKLNDITTAMIVNLNKICKCQMNSSFLLNSRLQCFDESQETVTFRTQLSATALASTTELMSYIEQWIESGDFLLNGVRLEFNTTCSLQISSFNADECPTSNRVTTVSPSTDIRTPVSGTVVGIILLAILLIICLITIVLLVGYIAVLKRKHTTHSKKGKRNEVEVKDTEGSAPEYEMIENKTVDSEYEEVDKLKDHTGRKKQPHPPRGEYELTQCSAYDPVNKD